MKPRDKFISKCCDGKIIYKKFTDSEIYDDVNDRDWLGTVQAICKTCNNPCESHKEVLSKCCHARLLTRESTEKFLNSGGTITYYWYECDKCRNECETIDKIE